MLCVLGCLDTKYGKQIANEMLNWLKPEHNVLEIHQEPPGKLFEYPAINYVIRLAIDTNEPVLYVHTKGAGNPIPPQYKKYIINKNINVPETATKQDCQKTVRNMWKHEFTGERLQDYLTVINTNKPTVVCPLTGIEKVTWQNGWIINPAAAKILRKSFHFDSNRYYYENLFSKTNINVIGMISNTCNRKDNLYLKKMWNIIWEFYDI